MASHRHGSALVVAEGVVVGIFTTTDALRALATLLRASRAGVEESDSD
jgi:acetoin utilization protein AcuB